MYIYIFYIHTIIISTLYTHYYTIIYICVGVELLYICMNEGSSPLVCGMLWPKHNRPCDCTGEVQ